MLKAIVEATTSIFKPNLDFVNPNNICKLYLLSKIAFQVVQIRCNIRCKSDAIDLICLIV
jgi:hypothetical protein